MAKVFEIDVECDDLRKYLDGIKDGDIIEHYMDPDYGYGPGGKYIWWNGREHQLATDIDEYGNIPRFVQISDTNGFTPHYWSGKIESNMVWFTDEIINRINFNQKDCTVMIGGVEYTFRYDGCFKLNPDSKKLCFYTYDNTNTVYYANV